METDKRIVEINQEIEELLKDPNTPYEHIKALVDERTQLEFFVGKFKSVKTTDT